MVSYIEQPETYVSTGESKDATGAWIEVELSTPTPLGRVEAWMPEHRCDATLMTNKHDVRTPHRRRAPSPPRARSTGAERERRRAPPTHPRQRQRCVRARHQGGLGLDVASPDRPLLIELRNDAGEVVAHHEFTADYSVYVASFGGVRATRVRVVARGAGRTLKLAQLVARSSERTEECSPDTCSKSGGKCVNGKCVCSGNQVGPNCRQNIAGINRYLPSVPAHGWWDDGAAQAWGQIFGSISRSNCGGNDAALT